MDKLEEHIKRELQGLSRFNSHFTIYIIVISTLWLVWWAGLSYITVIWPMYVSIGWGLILLLHFIVVYRLFRKRKNADRISR